MKTDTASSRQKHRRGPGRRALAAGVLCGALAALPASAAGAAQCRAESGATSTALIELYTSEGCSSCPPADRWLSRLPVSDGRTVALAFHVDYWDDLGWPDRFAQAKFSTRQRETAALGRSRFVYTPQVMLNGQDYRDWANADLPRRLAAIHRQAARATLTLGLKTAGAALDVSATARADDPDAAYYLALVESGLHSEVKAGENRGASLRHDFVVRQWLGPFPLTPPATPRTHRVVIPADAVAAGMNVVAVVQQRRSGEVLQALSLKLCAGAS